ncbi:acyl carrier protein [Plantactinospora siamensis]|uniref:Acyl carrier protein n=1 Tax=Plantactinospora siamensis TaxID=555372 RepID=A0ABV6NWL0_9ACTN
MTADAIPPTEDIQQWLTERVAHYLDRAIADIEPDVPLAEYGVDSVYVASVFGEAEERYGVRLEPATAWDHPTVEALSKHLHSLLVLPAAPAEVPVGRAPE